MTFGSHNDGRLKQKQARRLVLAANLLTKEKRGRSKARNLWEPTK